GIGLGGALTPISVSWIMRRWGWQSSFYIFGIVGLILAACWYVYATDRPEEHPGVTPAELQVIRSTSKQGNTLLHRNEEFQPKRLPFLHMLRKPSVWFLV